MGLFDKNVPVPPSTGQDADDRPACKPAAQKTKAPPDISWRDKLPMEPKPPAQ